MKKKFILLSLALSGTLLIGCTGKIVADNTEKIPLELEIVEQQAEVFIDDTETFEEGSLEFYQSLVEDLNIIEIYDCSEMTTEILENRDGKIIIEKCIGVVTSSEGDGKILNCSNEEYDYISYSSVENIREGTVVLTYLVYNPDTNYTDDILERFDYIIDRENED